NVRLEPGPSGSPDAEQIVADTKDGVLIDGRGSYSIDQQRYNGQFGGNCFWEIKNGKIARMVTDVTYNAITTDFWANLDAIGSRRARCGSPTARRSAPCTCSFRRCGAWCWAPIWVDGRSPRCRRRCASSSSDAPWAASSRTSSGTCCSPPPRTRTTG